MPAYLADQVGACTVALMPLFDRLRRTSRRPSDCMAMTPRCLYSPNVRLNCPLWVYVRDAFAYGAPPASVFYYSRNHGAQHPQAHLSTYAGFLQADAFGDFRKLYADSCIAGLILEAG